MRKIILVGVIATFIFLMFSPIVSSTYSHNDNQSTNPESNQEVVLIPYIYGTIRCLFAPAVYWGIGNFGEDTAENVSGVFTIQGGFDDSINYVDSYFFGDIEAGYATGRFLPRNVDGFGPIVLSLKATSSNAEKIDISLRGFQIGFRTFVFG